MKSKPTLFFLIGLALVALARASLIDYGLGFSDTTWMFHFGRRVLGGELPYRDFIFQTGPFPLFFEALLQKIFGSHYGVSMACNLLVMLATALLQYGVAVRLHVDRWAAALIILVTGLTVIPGSFFHWNKDLANFFCWLAAFAWLRTPGTKVPLWKSPEFRAGLALGCVFFSRQSNGMVTAAAAFGTLGAASLFHQNRDLAWRTTRLVSGWACTIVFVLLILQALGIGQLAIQQMVLDAAQKKSAGGIRSIADALTGGGAVLGPPYSVWSGIWQTNRYALLFLAVTGAIVLWRPAFSFVVLAAWAPAYFLERYPLTSWADLPRVFLSFLALALAIPALSRKVKNLRLELNHLFPLVIALGCTWAMEMSVPLRGWVDYSVVLPMAFLTWLHFARTSQAIFVLASAALVAFALLYTPFKQYRAGDNPFYGGGWREGGISELVSRDIPRIGRRLIAPKRDALFTWLLPQVAPGSTCFVHGNWPVLYTILDCRNPTLLDTTIPDFFTSADGEKALRALRNAPPDWIIEQVGAWMSPPLDLAPESGDYGILNPSASRTMHVGLRELILDYELSGTFSPNGFPGVTASPELNQLRLYRRKATR
jgi:hypothetical protein